MVNDQQIFRIGTWNVDWAKPGTPVGNAVQGDLAEPGCNILCVTEGCAELLPADGHVICAGEDWGYRPKRKECRKVLLWSEESWTNPDRVGSEALPPGRFVAGMTQTAIGPLTVVGVCIPWHDAHVRTGRKDRETWQDHQTWLAAFERLPYRKATERTVVLGDFNQRIPWTWGKKRAHQALLKAFEGFKIATTGDIAEAPGRSIDHIAHTPDMALVGKIGIWPERSVDNRALSDHFGVWGDYILL